ncbi:symmetrical bis(5'-nucleosyl)-tetraphosphatase [Blochmannia endosymbiont of Camponotus sp. C-003]|uniref:symmetrical bis(5'-nucleosyl)-tetraphosphatase n=1 Tax=unclassified Candidatus Blochmanniella TaxID=711328 RepID=UPI0020240B93|nr:MULTISPECIES: symmetrical bis(5'-nucleosyl)-tetraphosphatase [unclassified Candidatus Blochmannia]URJ23116.1 symmetrical bis(5'-nucleosyl)-tetraphosphatase [Blochmannia endosymbiont of Camponotus sp. C-003]URJ28585.1 symmetrical bis(5'-nucleosyl)-tetraphosphatase [Blochmannia endosymbiont of Camponotus sp. C-046]
MSTYFIGDVHGCYKHLQTILNHVCFNPKVDTLHFTGDLIARGPNSLEVLRLAYELKDSAYLVLGNHELHLLKTYFGIIDCNKKRTDQFDAIFNASDIEDLINWLRHQPMLFIDENNKILMTHAGISPSWNVNDAKKYAKEIEKILVSDHYFLLFKKDIHNNISDTYHINDNKLKQIQENINVFTRMRYVDLNGKLDLKYKGIPKDAPAYIYPWFSLKNKLIDPTYSIIFGHWASLEGTKIPSGIYGLDSGCCWGGALTLLRWEDKKIVSIPCTLPD